MDPTNKEAEGVPSAMLSGEPYGPDGLPTKIHKAFKGIFCPLNTII